MCIPEYNVYNFKLFYKDGIILNHLQCVSLCPSPITISGVFLFWSAWEGPRSSRTIWLTFWDPGVSSAPGPRFLSSKATWQNLELVILLFLSTGTQTFPDLTFPQSLSTWRVRHCFRWVSFQIKVLWCRSLGHVLDVVEEYAGQDWDKDNVGEDC